MAILVVTSPDHYLPTVREIFGLCEVGISPFPPRRLQSGCRRVQPHSQEENSQLLVRRMELHFCGWRARARNESSRRAHPREQAAREDQNHSNSQVFKTRIEASFE